MKKIHLFLLLIPLLTYCQKDLLGEFAEEPQVLEADCITLSNGKVLEKYGEYYIMEGDMILTQEQVDHMNSPETRANRTSLLTRRWWYNNSLNQTIVNYDISNVDINMQKRVLRAFKHYESLINIRFMEGQVLHSGYIKFIIDPERNHSFVGMKGGMQELRLQPTAPYSTIVHEIGHAIGLRHEHNRYDRDNFITINYDNIASDVTVDLVKESANDMYGPYDIQSIMHYGCFEPGYSKGKPNYPIFYKKGTTETWEPNLDGLSPGDIAALRSMYQGLPAEPGPINLGDFGRNTLYMGFQYKINYNNAERYKLKRFGFANNSNAPMSFSSHYIFGDSENVELFLKPLDYETGNNNSYSLGLEFGEPGTDNYIEVGHQFTPYLTFHNKVMKCMYCVSSAAPNSEGLETIIQRIRSDMNHPDRHGITWISFTRIDLTGPSLLGQYGEVDHGTVILTDYNQDLMARSDGLLSESGYRQFLSDSNWPSAIIYFDELALNNEIRNLEWEYEGKPIRVTYERSASVPHAGRSFAYPHVEYFDKDGNLTGNTPYTQFSINTVRAKLNALLPVVVNPNVHCDYGYEISWLGSVSYDQEHVVSDGITYLLSIIPEDLSSKVSFQVEGDTIRFASSQISEQILMDLSQFLLQALSNGQIYQWPYILGPVDFYFW